MKLTWSSIKYIFPNIFTALSLCSGLLSLQNIIDANYVTASWLIVLSMLFDGIDGKVARLLNASSKFGAIFDTLSDFVVFGIVPAFLAYHVSLFKEPVIGKIMAFFYILSGGFRLVRFTIKVDTSSKEKKSFIGLPIPAAAGLIAALTLVNFHFWSEIKTFNLYYLIIFFGSILMVSKIEYFCLDKKARLSKETIVVLILAIISSIFAINYSFMVFSCWIIGYVIYGLIRQLYLLKTKR